MTKTTPRLHTGLSLSQGAVLVLPREQAHYLGTVLRLVPGDALRLFNSRDGEWLAYLTAVGKKGAEVKLERNVAEVNPPPDIDYIFAPLKHARLDYVVQKATELGVRRLRPVITARTVADRVNLERMRANVIEAAEQCNLVFLPEVLEPVKFSHLMAGWEPSRTLVHCDETAGVKNPLQALAGLAQPAAVIIGPEGGFTDEERRMIRAVTPLCVISLGPRIMRADTAAVAALTLVQAVAGDWDMAHARPSTNRNGSHHNL